jgi:hypothetical protein
MKKIMMIVLALSIFLPLTGCNLLTMGTDTPLPTSTTIPSPTPMPTNTLSFATPTNTSAPLIPVPSLTPIPNTPAPTSTTGALPPVIVSGAPSGPYGVILVSAGDVLYIRNAPGAGNPVVGSFAATATNVMRSGRSSNVGGALWVEVQNPGGGVGWVNSHFLTEYVSPAAFCANASVTTLIANLDTALTSNNGVALSGLVSPVHGMTVYLWRYGNSVTFEQNDARWVFDSTYEHHWGQAPGSGLDTNGSFHVAVLPFLQEVFNAAYTLTCDSLGTAPNYGGEPWPLAYTNVNYYTVYKPGTPGVDLDFRFFLVGVEFVQGQPTVFSLIHFAWEP